MVQTATIGSVADIHPWAFTNRIKPLKDGNTGRVVVFVIFSHIDFLCVEVNLNSVSRETRCALASPRICNLDHLEQ